MTSDVRIGVMFRREQPANTLPDFARRVEAYGFDELWVVEDCFYHGGVAQAATALAVTEQITVGLGIVPAVARNAAFLAMEFATLGAMYPGRFHGGIGHGVAEWMEQIGARPASWLVSLEETTAAVRSIMRGGSVTTKGRYVRLTDVQLEHLLPSIPPVSLGVRGPKSLELSGRCADGTLLAENSSPDYVARTREIIARGMRDAGRTEHHHLTVYAHCAVSGSDPESARQLVRRATADSLGPSTLSQTEPLPYAREIERLIERGGSEALFDEMPDAWLNDLAITGTPVQGAESVRRLADAGADAVILMPPVGLDPDRWLNSVAEELLPLIAGRT